MILASETEIKEFFKMAVREELKDLLQGASATATGQRAPATRKETAEYLGLSAQSVDTLVKSGQLKSFNIGRSVRFRWADIEAYINAQA